MDVIFFDLGWTLEDESAAQRARALDASRALARRGVDASPERVLELQDEAAAAMVPSVFAYALRALCGDDAKAVASECRWDTSLLTLYPGVPQALAALRKMATLGVIANQSDGAPARLEAYGIGDLFAVVASSFDVGFAKPDVRLYEHALAALSTGGDGAVPWMVGDRIDNDVIPARALGWRTVRVLQGYNRLQSPRTDAEIADHTAQTITDAVAYLATRIERG